MLSESMINVGEAVMKTFGVDQAVLSTRKTEKHLLEIRGAIANGVISMLDK